MRVYHCLRLHALSFNATINCPALSEEVLVAAIKVYCSLEENIFYASMDYTCSSMFRPDNCLLFAHRAARAGSRQL